MSELMCSQSKCRRKDEHIAELKAELAELREFAFVCIEMQRAGLSTKDAINSMEAALLQERGE